LKNIFSILLFNMFFVSYLLSQTTCIDNCGSGSLQDYWSGAIDCVCSLDCAGYGDACCDFYDACYENPSNLDISDFVGTWEGNITNDGTWPYDDFISIDIEANGEYTVTNNPGGHLVSDLYPGTEEVYYGTNFYGVNILQFRWVQYYHYSCGGGCYSGVSFQVMDYENGSLTLFYNNGSGPAPQANSMFLILDGWNSNILGDLNQDGSINISDIVLVVNIVLGGALYNHSADLNEDQNINIQDVILLVQMILNP